MPYLCTHLAFGVRVVQALGVSTESQGELYPLGCFGPDVFFYDRLPPTPFIPNRKKHGNALHATDAAVLFRALLDAAEPALYPYLRGLLTHIALDGALHPYVEARHTGLDHTRFEGVIDSLIFAQTREKIPYEAFLKRKPDVDAIDRLWTDVTKALFGKDVRGAYRRSVRKFHRIVPFLFDPNGRRFRPIRRVERMLRKEGLLSAFLLAAPRENAEDCMNLSRAAWRAPWATERVRTESVPMLIDEAETLAVALIRAFDERDLDTLMRLLSGRTMQKGVL